MNGTKTTLTLGTYERVTKVEAWRDNYNYKWYRLKLTFNSQKTQEYDATPAGSANTIHTYDVPPGYEFTGFWLESDWNFNCVVSQVSVEVKSAQCCVYLVLSSIEG